MGSVKKRGYIYISWIGIGIAFSRYFCWRHVCVLLFLVSFFFFASNCSCSCMSLYELHYAGVLSVMYGETRA